MSTQTVIIKLTLGHFIADESATAIANGDKFFQRHAAILGSTGSGKTWAVALMLERAAALKAPNLIVFDMHGEYSTLCKDTPETTALAEQYRIAGPGDLENPNDQCLFLPYWLLNQEEMLAMILDRSDGNAPNQAARFTEHVKKLKEKTLVDLNKTDALPTFTVDSPIPYMINDLVNLLIHDDQQKVKGTGNGDKAGSWHSKLTRFIARLKTKIDDRRNGFMFQPPTSCQSYEWVNTLTTRLFASGQNFKGVKTIDFSEVPSDILPIVTGVLARLLFSVQFWMDAPSRHPLTIVCDEAHLYLPVRDAVEAAEKRALEAFDARIYGWIDRPITFT